MKKTKRDNFDFGKTLYKVKLKAIGDLPKEKWIWPHDLSQIRLTFEALYINTFKKPDRKKPLLIMGETGVGKSAFLDLFHDNYKKDNPKAKSERLNISALPGALIESELFGHGKGAFTDATSSYPGLIGKLKDGDLLILEEIGELSSFLQAKLLTFIEDGEYRKLHDLEVYKAQNIQIIGTTNRKPEDKNLRKDFYNRFLSFYIPPLRERMYDIQFYAEKLCPDGWRLITNEYKTGLVGMLEKDVRASGVLQVKGARPTYCEAKEEFLAFSWPGNVREVMNVLEMLSVISRTWSYKAPSTIEKKSWNFNESYDRDLKPMMSLYDAIKNTFALHDPLIIKIALRALAPDKATKTIFLKLWHNEFGTSKQEEDALKHALVSGPAISKEDLLEVYFSSLMTRSRTQAEAAKMAGMANSSLSAALKKYGISNK